MNNYSHYPQFLTMFSKNTITKIFFIFTIFIAIFPKFIRAEDDDDDIVGEIIMDLAVGVMIAMCETSVTCSSFMNIVIIIALISLPFCLCAGVIEPGDICNKKHARRGLTTGVGYSVARSFR